VQGVYGAEDRNVLEVHEDLSTGATQQFDDGASLERGLMMYINSMGIRAIARVKKVKKVHNSVISVWIKQIGKVAKDVFSEKIKEIEPNVY
jgi:hypothetical protein